MDLPPLRLKKNEDRRVRAGHLWVFSNEVDTASTPLVDFEPGAAVEVQDSGGRSLGSGYVNPRSLIAARLISRAPRQRLDGELLRDRIGQALALREACFDVPFYRLVFGEGDWLPGLVVDRYGDVLTVQITTAGMERVRDEVVSVLLELLRPAGLLLRNDTPARALEGLGSSIEVVAGDVPELVEIEENATRFEVPLLSGQKTGWFYDHRPNRAVMRGYARDAVVLDVFSYLGGWGLQAATAGARSVLCVDVSAPALEHLARNTELNGCAGRVDVLEADAFAALRELRSAGRSFDLVILDPPAFVKRKKDTKQGEEAYRRLNQLAVQVLATGGILVSASCSFHLPRDRLRAAMLRASRTAGRELQILEQGHQGADHPVHPAIPETDYLKCFIGRVV